jgi:Heavy-metal resistance protein CzcE
MRTKIPLWLLVCALAACDTVPLIEQPLQLLGDPAQAGSGSYTLAISPDTKHVNVTGGEVVNFNVDGKIFAWHFFVPYAVTQIDLKRVAPPGMLNRSVFAYVAPDPRYIKY